MNDLSDDELRARLQYAMKERPLEPFVEPLRELQRRRVAQAACEERAREAETEARAEQTVCAERIANLQARVAELEAAGAIADRVVEQPTATQPGHVCPVPYEPGPEDVDALSELAVHAEMADWPRAREALDKILAARRPPDPAVGPLPEVIACGTEGCVSSIKKSYLPSGWVLRDGTWRCPRCKMIATTEAS